LAAALGDDAALALGLGVAVEAVLAAGFWAQPLAISAIALKRNRNFFIHPPIELLFYCLEIQPEGNQAGSWPGKLDVIAGGNLHNQLLKSFATLLQVS
jgi:hypothetical protein